MLTHVVLFRLKDEYRDQAAELCRQLTAMRGRIPWLKEIEAGTDVLHSDRSYDVALITRFESLADMQKYQVHPVHQEVLSFVRSITQHSITVDFES